LFSETGRVSPPVGMRTNFWMVEGAALYMESLRRWDRCWTVGGLDAHRLQYARYRVLTDKFYLPLEDLAKLGRQGLQQHPEIRQLYSQAAGLAAFLMDYRRGCYREALVLALQAVYQGRDRPDTLASLAGAASQELDRQYREFLQVTDADLAYLAALPGTRSLALGHTAISDVGLRHLAGQTQLEWLDVGYTKTTDAGLAWVKAATHLNRLNVEHTQVTDAACEIIRNFRALEILDLSGDQITDAGLARLTPLTRLKELWLTGTQVSDAGLAPLRNLKQLETVDISHTRVTADGWKQLRAALPNLKDN
jgi:hypothetical protein